MPTVSYKTIIQALLLVSYPVSCHFAVVLDKPLLQLIALMFLSLGVVLRGLLEQSVSSWAMVAALLLLALLLAANDALRYVFYLPPVVFPLLLWGVFRRSLQPGRTPLVTGIAREVRGSLSPELCDYTRSVTAMWSAVFVILAVGSAGLPFLASDPVWSLFTNFLNYLLIVLLFVLEFVYRQWRFRELEHKSFYHYLQSIVRVDVRQFR